MKTDNKPERKDYCGPWWMPSWMRKLLSGKFNASCRIHDRDYSPSTKFTRKEADVRFKDHMLRQSKDSKKWKMISYIYYMFVRIGGSLSFKKDK